MVQYRRYRVAGGTYFFTVTLLERQSDLLVRHIDVLRAAFRRVRSPVAPNPRSGVGGMKVY